jgi:long-subunit fatty acid transport protein
MKKLSVVLLTTLPGAAMAASPMDLLRYSYVEASYASTSVDDADVDFNGFALKGSFVVADQVYVIAGYDRTESDEVNGVSVQGDDLFAGLGVRLPIAPQADVDLEGRYIHAKAEINGGPFDGADDSANGYGIGGKVRYAFNEMVEGNAGIEYTDATSDDDNNDDSGETAYGIGGVVNFTPTLAAVGSYTWGDDADTWTLGGRLNFGM